jgi:hypothetical protein
VLCFSLLSAVRPSGACRWGSVRAYSVLGSTVHVGPARDFIFVEVAPCPCGQSLAYAVPLVCVLPSGGVSVGTEAQEQMPRNGGPGTKAIFSL